MGADGKREKEVKVLENMDGAWLSRAFAMGSTFSI